MFESKKKQKCSTLETVGYSSIIDKGIVIEGGIIKGEGNIRINGCYTGEIKIDGNLSIGSDGVINGDVCANSADIAGKCKGNITAFALVHLSPTATVEGSMHSESIVIDENANFNGTCKMGKVTVASKEKETKSAPVKVGA